MWKATWTDKWYPQYDKDFIIIMAWWEKLLVIIHKENEHVRKTSFYHKKNLY
jgi:hypothetical protein